MRTFRGAAGALLLLTLASCGVAIPQSEEPQWVERPSAEAIRRYYPEAAVAQQIVGVVTMDCKVALDSTVACEVIDEAPQGWNFGNAALALSTTFQLRPGTVGEEPVANMSKEVRIRFAGVPASEPTPEELSFREHVPQPELPHWDLAPTAFEVAAVFPPAAVGQVERARAVLQCRVNLNRTLACEPLLATPADMGFAEAAMQLSTRFRVAELSSEFITAHTTDAFLLPVNFGASANEEPLSMYYSGAGPILFAEPPPHVIQQIYPPGAAAQRIAGRASILCTLRAGQNASCAVESESPAGWGFGAAGRGAARQLDLTIESTGMLAGDQVRVPFTFTPPR